METGFVARFDSGNGFKQWESAPFPTLEQALRTLQPGFGAEPSDVVEVRKTSTGWDEVRVAYTYLPQEQDICSSCGTSAGWWEDGSFVSIRQGTHCPHCGGEA